MKEFILALILGIFITSATYWIGHSVSYQPGTIPQQVTVRGLPLPFYENPKPQPIFGDVSFTSKSPINIIVFVTDILLWSALLWALINKASNHPDTKSIRPKLGTLNRTIKGVMCLIFIVIAYLNAPQDVYYSNVQWPIYAIYDYLCLPIVILGLTALYGLSLKGLLRVLIRPVKNLRNK